MGSEMCIRDSSLLTDSPAEVRRAAASTLALLWWDTNNQEIVQRLLGQYEQIDSIDRNMLVAAVAGVIGGTDHLIVRAELVRNPPPTESLENLIR